VTLRLYRQRNIHIHATRHYANLVRWISQPTILQRLISHRDFLSALRNKVGKGPSASDWNPRPPSSTSEYLEARHESRKADSPRRYRWSASSHKRDDFLQTERERNKALAPGVEKPLSGAHSSNRPERLVLLRDVTTVRVNSERRTKRGRAGSGRRYGGRSQLSAG